MESHGLTISGASSLPSPRPVREIENAWIPLSDGTRLAAPHLAAGGRRAPTRCRPSSSTCPTASATARRERDALTHPYLAGHGYACVRVDIRGSRRFRRRAVRRVQPAGAGRRARGHRLAGGPALVQRRGRHDRHLLGRLQRAAGRGAPAAGAEGDRHAVLDRRPLSPTTSTTWAAPAQRQASAGRAIFFADMAHPPDPALVGERWRDDVAGAAARTLPLFLEHWLRAPAPRRLLEARLGLRGLCARSSARSMRSAAGPTATPTRSRACSSI